MHLEGIIKRLDVVRVEDEPVGPDCKLPSLNALPSDYDPVLPETDSFGPMERAASTSTPTDHPYEWEPSHHTSTPVPRRTR